MSTVLNTENDQSLLTSVVPVTQDILSSAVAALVERYRFFAKASAENIIQLAKTVADANAQLTKPELVDFCKAIGVLQKSSTYRKLLKIGLSADRFDSHLDKMPTAWTTVYNLTTLTPDEFEAVSKNEAFTPTMTARTISTIVGSAKKERQKQDNSHTVTPPESPTTALPDDTAIAVVPDSKIGEPLGSTRTMVLNFDGLDDSDVEDIYMTILLLQGDKRFTFEMSEGMRPFAGPSGGKKLPFQMEHAA